MPAGACLFVKENTSENKRRNLSLQMCISACSAWLRYVEGMKLGKSELRNVFLHALMNVTIFLVAMCYKNEVMYKVLSHL